MNQNRAKYVWDYNITQEQFDAMLAGQFEDGHLNRDWAAVRVIEWAKYEDMIRILGYFDLVNNWSRWRERIRSEEQRRSLDFVVRWLPEHRPDLLIETSTK